MAFHPIDRDTDYLLPPSVQEWLPEAHLAHYVVDVAAGLNQPGTLLADTGYFSQKNVAACHTAKIAQLIAVKRDAHHPAWRERFTEPAPLAGGASTVDTIKHAFKTRTGRAAYAQRKQTVEPVFGIIKSVMGFRQFLPRGLENVENELALVYLAWNLKRMDVLRPQQQDRTRASRFHGKTI